MIHFSVHKNCPMACARQLEDFLGFLPQMFSLRDPRPARAQLQDTYAHGGGWRPVSGFKKLGDDSIKYPGDPALPPLAIAWLRDEHIIVYPSAWVAIVQSDDSFEIARMD